jgi:hypothetical protein
MKLSKLLAGASFLLLTLSACGGTGDYPPGYIGFEKSTLDISFNPSLSEYVFSVKIVASDKSDADRTLTIVGSRKPGESDNVFQVETPRVVLPAGRKSVDARVKIFPQKIKGRRDIILMCTPQNIPDAKNTQIRVTVEAGK